MWLRQLLIEFVPRVILVLLAVLLGELPLTSTGALEGPGNPKSGRDLFVKKGCMRCHSIWESGGKRGPSLAAIGMGRNLYELCASVWSHWPRMNAVLDRDREERISLTASEFRDIIAYLYYLNYNAEPGQASLGEAIFIKKGCIQCHALEPLRTKGKPGRAVYEMQEFQGAVPLAVAVWNHGTDMFQTMSRRRIQWPEFQEKEVAHLLEFIRSRNGAPREVRMLLTGDPLRGQSLFAAKSCSVCHKSESSASSPGPNLASRGAATSLSSLVARLWNHYPRMSRTIATSGVLYPKVTKEEMEDILAYVYWLRAYGLAGNPAAGRNLYKSKQCASCHSPSEAKQAPGPNLIGAETTRSVYALLAAIWNHGPRMESLLRERNSPWPALNGEEMRDLVSFLRKGTGGRP